MPILPTGLRRDRNTGVYYFRRRIPADLLPCYPSNQREVGWSLKTKVYATAKEQHRSAEAKQTAEWSQMRQNLADQAACQTLQALTRINALTSEEIDSICLHFETANACVVGMHVFRSTFLAKAQDLGVVNAEAITGHASNITEIQQVKDDQVEQQTSTVVRRYKGELALDKKMAILKRITFDGLAFHRPVDPSIAE